MAEAGQLEFWTVGHSNLTVDALIALLRAHGMALLIDVRQYPMSRRNPQFNRDTLPVPLEAAGIDYLHEPSLGGRRRPRPDSPNTGWQNAGFRGYADYMETAEFGEALDRVEALGAERRPAFMCAESVPWRCHRNLIADALTARGHRVRHILSERPADVHRLTPFAQVDRQRVHYPGLPLGSGPPPRTTE